MVRLGQFDGQAPLEARKQPLLEVLQVCRRAVGGEHQLLAGLMKMIEYVEERVLRGRAVQFLDVIHYEDIDPHVEGHEVSQLVLYTDRIDVLGPELVAGDIEDNKIRVGFVDGDTDRLREMGLAKSRATEDEQRVERSLARLV